VTEKGKKMANSKDALRQAVRLLKSGDFEQLNKFLERAVLRFPDRFELWEIFYLACRNRLDIKGAALVALRCLAAHPESKMPDQWLEQILLGLKAGDDELLEAARQLPGKFRYRYAAVFSILFENLPEGKAALSRLEADWPSEMENNLKRFAELAAGAGFFEEAEKLFWKLLERNPLAPEVLRQLVENQLGWGEKGNPEKIFETQQLAELLLRRFPEMPEAWFAMGMFWRAVSRPERSLPFLMKYFEARPESRWRSGLAFDVAYMEDMPQAEVLEIRRSWSNFFGAKAKVSGPPLHRDRNPNRRLRIGYVSPDFGRHPVGHFARTILLEHDRDAVEVFFYSHRNRTSEFDDVSKVFFEWAGESHWRWIKEADNLRLLKMVREDRIDILVDLAGHSMNNRLDVFCNRGAPVQVSWLGAPGTTGVVEMDYRFSDAIVEPEGESDRHSSEKIWRLPNGFHAITFPEATPEPSPPPMLENGYITFGSFNNAKKLSAETIALWARIMQEIPNARMLLKHVTMQNFTNREMFRSLFVLEGVDPSRILFQGPTPWREDHFAHYSKLDVALDPLAYNGTTTTCEALYMGVPVLTRTGTTHASRVSSSLLHRVGLDGWAAASDDHFIRIAKAAAAKPEVLASRRASLRSAYLASPLGRGRALARDLESAYRDMWEIKCAEEIRNSNNVKKQEIT